MKGPQTEAIQSNDCSMKVETAYFNSVLVNRKWSICSLNFLRHLEMP